MNNSASAGQRSNGLELKCNMTGTYSFVFVFIPVVYCCNFLLGMVGNSMVVAVIHYYMKLKTVANIFVLNLAVSDLTFLLTLPMWATVTAMGYHWPFGSFLCKSCAGLVVFNLYTSVFFLTALSIDRYLAIVRPVESRRYRTVRYARLTCMLVWLVSLALSLPTALTRSTIPIKASNITVCGLSGDDSDRWLLPLNLTKGVLGFAVPLAVILTCYCLIGRELQGHGGLQSSGCNSTQGHTRGDEVLSMLAAAVLAFFLCWAPHQVFNLLYALVQFDVITDCATLDIIDTAMPFTVCIAFLNSCVNPILYGFVGKNFRRSLLRLLRCSGALRPNVHSHPSLATKMSTLSYRPSDSLLLGQSGKTDSLSRKEDCTKKKQQAN